MALHQIIVYAQEKEPSEDSEMNEPFIYSDYILDFEELLKPERVRLMVERVLPDDLQIASIRIIRE